MSYGIRALVVAAILLLPTVACGSGNDDDTSSPTPAGWESFSSDAHHYSIAHPMEWLVREGRASDAFTAPTSDHTSVLVEFGRGATNVEAGSPEYLDAVIESVRSNSGAEARFVDVEDLGSHQALVVEWQATLSDVDTYAFQAYVPNGDQSWYVTMTTSAGTKEDYKDTFRQILDSFEPSE